MEPHGLSQTTMGKLRAMLGSEILGSYDLNDPRLFDYTNELGEYLYTTGEYVGSTATFAFSVPTSKIITLPLHLNAVLGARIDGTPRPVVGEGYQYLWNGPGDLTDTCYGLLAPLGSSPVETQLSADGTLLVTSSITGSDNGKFVRVLGKDADGDTVYDAGGLLGENLTIGGSASSTTFSEITGVQKPKTAGVVTLKTGITTLSAYPSGEELPVYRRYQVFQNGVETVTAHCSRRWIPLNSYEEYLVPGNIRGWKLLFMAREHENRGRLAEAEAYYAIAVKTFNQEVRRNEANNVNLQQVDVQGFDVRSISPVG